MTSKLFFFLSFILILVLSSGSRAAQFKTPSQERNFTVPTTHQELKEFIKGICYQSPHLEYEVFGQSVEGRELFVVKTTAKKNVQRNERLRIFVFAQLHGNEQSSKEAALLLLARLANGQYNHLLDKMELWVVPQVNPDGSEVNQRRNAANLDLNRDHVLLSSPEVLALHRLFYGFWPHVNIDIHEYQAITQVWEEFGGFKYFDVQVGTLTNPNISRRIIDYSQNRVLPHIESNLVEQGYTFHDYLVGQPPQEGLLRYSTTNINDGRQSFGVLGTMSFIYEGINGRDGFAENLERRTLSQTLALEALIERVAKDRRQVIRMVNQERRNLKRGDLNRVAVRAEHFRGNNPLELPLISARTGLDTMAIIESYHPEVNVLLEVNAPRAYLVPKSDTLLIELLQKHQVILVETFPDPSRVYQYTINEIGSTIAESNPNLQLTVTKNRITGSNFDDRYVLVPLQQLKSLFLVLILEPQSQIGLVQYPGFQHLLQTENRFPVLRAH
ncbi:MAG TPA: M14 family zinc carboxypeptidase [Bacteroidales bacterium]|nr:M14 family zinc carboxypeptidase [Bacteroidales bacterium]